MPTHPISKTSFLCLAILTVFGFFTGCTHALTLSTNSQTAYTIIIPDNPILPEKNAADRLSHYLHEITQADFPILPESQLKPAQNTKNIFVGRSAAAKKIAPDAKWESLGDDGILIKTVGENLILAGEGTRGTLYAVYSFLEDYAGCRWWSSNEQTIPPQPTLTIGEIDIAYTPPISVREIFNLDTYRSPEALVAFKLNGQYGSYPEEYGGHVYFIPDLVHTFSKLLPPDKYFATHPEWYSLIDGKRVQNAQLCVTNPQMRQEITRVLLEKLRADKDPRMVSLSQNDMPDGRCQCDNCKALETREGSPSGPLIDFVNAVAADLQKEFPRIMVETLAYTYTINPPKTIRPRENVIIRVVALGSLCSQEKPYTTNPSAAHYVETVKKWSRIAPHLYFWDYVASFGGSFLVPHPNLRAQAGNIRFFAQNHAKGVYLESYHDTIVGDFSRLKAWLMAHLLWNPNLDDKKLIAEFVNGYYGAAGAKISEYLDLVHNAFLSKDIRLTGDGSNLGYMSLVQMNQATTLFNDAEAAVADAPTLLARVQRERLVLDNLWLQRYTDLKRLAEIRKLPFMGPNDPVVACEKLIQQVRRFEGVPEGDWMPLSPQEPGLRQMAKAALAEPKPPAECANLNPADWVDIQDYRFSYGEPKDDPAASDGRTRQCFGAWGIMVPISGDVMQFWNGDWEMFVSVRVESDQIKNRTDQDKVAFGYGLYDYSTSSGSNINVHFNKIPDEQYHTYSLGTIRMNYNKCLWISQEKAGKVFLDRIFLIKKK